MVFAQAAGEPLPVTIGTLAGLVAVFVAFMRINATNNSRVDRVTASSIRLLAEERDRLVHEIEQIEHERDVARTEAEQWERQYQEHDHLVTRLRIWIARLESTNDSLAAALDTGMASSDDETSS